MLLFSPQQRQCEKPENRVRQTSIALGAYINNELIKLGIRDVKDAMSAIQNSTKEEIYRVLRNMNREDKKTAQQHLLNSYLNGGKKNEPQMAFILNEILSECGMIDKQI